MRKNWPVLTILAILSLAAAMACAQPIPTATPNIPATVEARLSQVPTATPYPTATPRPTLTPYPTPTARPTATAYPTATPRPTYTLYPTPTPLPTYTPYPTATAYPTYTPYPTPTPTPRPTATPRPTPTPRPSPTPTPFAWRSHSPFPYYSITLPADWRKQVQESEPAGSANISGNYTLFQSADIKADVTIYTFFARDGWPSGFGISEMADIQLDRDEPGFQIISLTSVSSTTKRSQYRYEGTGEGCDVEGQALHILVSRYSFEVLVEVCRSWVRKYDDAFVNRVLESFTYSAR